MPPSKSLDEHKLIVALLHDVYSMFGQVFDLKAQRLTTRKVESRYAKEGVSFLTKTLPRLGRALDKALSEAQPLNATLLRFESQEGSKLPKLFGELFNLVLDKDGVILPEPDIECVKVLRQLLFAFSKYELPYTVEQERKVVDGFVKTEDELSSVTAMLNILQRACFEVSPAYSRKTGMVGVTRKARALLERVLWHFDPLDIYPRHGPGAVATKQQLHEKYQWVNVSAKITEHYPLDAYFYASLGAFCDRYRDLNKIADKSLPAKVILVPKDSRGPRLISCEPVDIQWIQQGLGRALVDRVEKHKLTKFNVFFTQQRPNQIGALFGSHYGKYATLDLKEASDRVSVALVRLLFPARIIPYLEACRTSTTVLPNGKELKLRKFAPMGSCLCFPIMALSIWAILTAAAPDAYTRERIHVYGDDVIVPTAFAEDAIKQLESFGLRINHDKSCIKGFFRESCGLDAFKGIEVTPIKLRSVWSSSRSPGAYSSWISYANSFYDKRYFSTYDYIVSCLHRLYGAIPDDRMDIPSVPRLRVSNNHAMIPRRVSHSYQRMQHKVWCIHSPTLHRHMHGWDRLLRYFAERGSKSVDMSVVSGSNNCETFSQWFDTSSYTRRDTSMLVQRWR